jgi:hypothetical protein
LGGRDRSSLAQRTAYGKDIPLRNDNRPENLQVLTVAEHCRLHRLEDTRAVQELEVQDKVMQQQAETIAQHEALYGPLPANTPQKKVRVSHSHVIQMSLLPSA